jgi:hypothetical protein
MKNLGLAMQEDAALQTFPVSFHPIVYVCQCECEDIYEFKAFVIIMVMRRWERQDKSPTQDSESKTNMKFKSYEMEV